MFITLFFILTFFLFCLCVLVWCLMMSFFGESKKDFSSSPTIMYRGETYQRILLLFNKISN